MIRKGICVAGNLIVDIHYPLSDWPAQGELVTVLEGIHQTTGGLACNVAMDLAVLDPDLPLTVAGIVGDDAEGTYLLKEFGRFPSIGLSQVRKEGKTSFTMVMRNERTKERTFFQYRGANALFDESNIDWESLDAEILHIGYLLLLDALDAEDREYGTKMARLLHRAQTMGIRTSIDVVSEAGNRFKRIATPALRYADYCIINEIEAQQITGVMLRDEEGRLLPGHMPEALRAMRRLGVADWAVIHCPEGAYGMDRSETLVQRDSLSLPEGYIKGTVGAGDAFCAGVLLGASRHWPLLEAIELGIASATCSLSKPDASSGMRSVSEALALYRSMLHPGETLKNGE